jgi:hypothetical protein
MDKVCDLGLSQEPKDKRCRQPPSSLNDYFVHEKGITDETGILDERSEMRREYYKAIDAIVESLETRFEQTDLLPMLKINEVLINCANGSPPSQLEKDFCHFDELINLNELKAELSELPVYIKLFNQESSCKLKRITMVSTICDVMNAKASIKTICPNLHSLLILYHSFALSSATAERTFSVMRRVKSYLRTTMSANSLNNFMFATIHKDLMDEISVKKVAEEFINQTEERKNYFGKMA